MYKPNSAHFGSPAMNCEVPSLTTGTPRLATIDRPLPVDARSYFESKKKWFWEWTRRRWNEWLTEWENQTETLFNRHVWTVQVSPSDTGNVLTLTTVYSVNHTVALWDMPAGQRLFTYTKNTRAHTPQNTTQLLVHLLPSVFIHINIHRRSINTPMNRCLAYGWS